jgi:threonine aldolase
MRYDFASDNTAGLAPEAMDALVRANAGFARSYGADEITARAADQVRELVQADAEVRFLFSGTAANAIALSMLCQPFETVVAHEAGHIMADENGAPAFFGHGLGLTRLGGASGKADPAELKAVLNAPETGHRQPPGALSLTQATEYGAVYTAEALRHLIEPAKAKGLGVHLDGARLANAAAAGFDPADVARLGVDILILGIAKAGGLCVDALVLFDKRLSRRIDNRLKQAGQIASKARFLAAPALGLLESGAWIGHAAHANRMAKRLAELVAARTPFALAHPVDANLVFLRLPAAAHARLTEAGWACHRVDDGSVRFVCSWATTEDAVEAVTDALARAAQAA